MIQRENHKSEAIDVQRKSINTAFYYHNGSRIIGIFKVM